MTDEGSCTEALPADGASPPQIGVRRLGHHLATLAGLVLLAWLIHEGGAEEVGLRLARLGRLLPLALAPYVLASLLDALGWRLVLRAFGVAAPFARLWLVRLAGEAVNGVAPTGIGGEPLKAVLLRADGAPGSAVAAAVVVSRTCLTVTQALLVVFGVGALLQRLGWTVAAPFAVAGLLVLTAAFALALVGVQQRGLAGPLVSALSRWLLPESLTARARRAGTSLDARLALVYRRERLALLAACTFHMLAWLLSVAEVWLLLRLLGAAVPWRDALIIEGLAQPIRASTILVPGALGTQEGGGVALCRWIGIPPAIGLTMWLVRRGREIIFDAVGLLYLAAWTPWRLGAAGDASVTFGR